MKKYIPLVLMALLVTGCGFSRNPSSSSSEEITTSETTSNSSSEETSNSSSENSSEDESSETTSEENSSTNNGESNDALLAFDAPTFYVPKRETKDDVEFEDLFNLGNKVAIKVEISESELQELQNKYDTGYKSEIYRVADKVTISLTNYGNTFTGEFPYVGIRQRGNTSRRSVIVDGEINPHNHFKLSFDETFDDEEMYSASFIDEMQNKMNGEDYGDREFLGLSGLDFKWNKNYDTTHIKEVYSSYIYQAGGIISQHIGLSNFSIVRKEKDNKTTDFGLCTLYEPASKSIIKRSLKNDTDYLNMGSWSEEKDGEFGVPDENYGDFYKCTYGVGEGYANNGCNMTLDSIGGKRIGVGNISGSYVPAYERKTNKDADDNHVRLRNLITTINNENYTEIEKVVDLQYFAKKEAITYLIGNPDALRYNYNNYFIYIRKTDGKAIIMPYDNDRCFGITKDMNLQNGLTNGTLLSKVVHGDNQQVNPLFLKTILSDSTNKAQEDYLAICDVLRKSDWVKTSTFDAYYNLAKTTYSEREFEPSNENMSFNDYITGKLKTMNQYFEQENDDTTYNNLYIVGNFNSWGNYSNDQLDLYKFEYIGNYQYKVVINIEEELEDNVLQFKINAGQQNWSDIDWTVDMSEGKLIKEKSSNAVIPDVYEGDQIEIIINTNTLDVTINRK